MKRLLPEEIAFNDIRGRIIQSEIEFDATTSRDRVTRLKAAKRHMQALNQAVAEVCTLEETVDEKIRKIEVGNIPVSDPNCEYWQLLNKKICSNVGIKDKRDEFEAWLKEYEKNDPEQRAA